MTDGSENCGMVVLQLLPFLHSPLAPPWDYGFPGLPDESLLRLGIRHAQNNCLSSTPVLGRTLCEDEPGLSALDSNSSSRRARACVAVAERGGDLGIDSRQGPIDELALRVWLYDNGDRKRWRDGRGRRRRGGGAKLTKVKRGLANSRLPFSFKTPL